MDCKQKKVLLVPLLGAFMLLILTGGLLLFRNLQTSFGERTTAKNLEMIPSKLAVLREEEGEAQEATVTVERYEELSQNMERKSQGDGDLEVEGPPLKISELEAGVIIEAKELDFESLEQYFVSMEIEEGGEVYQRIYGRSYVDNPHITLDELRYLKLLHYNFDHVIQVGELIINVELEEDCLEIFRELFEREYEIQSMYLIDNYWTGDGGTSDFASIEVNNTSAFCYREITGGARLSNHALGKAIDINPQQKPYVSYSGGRHV